MFAPMLLDVFGIVSPLTMLMPVTRLFAPVRTFMVTRLLFREYRSPVAGSNVMSRQSVLVELAIMPPTELGFAGVAFPLST